MNLLIKLHFEFEPAKFNVVPFAYNPEVMQTPYEEVLNFFESNLLLYKQSHGSLYREHGEYIALRTGGYIGAISDLIREAASLAIKTGTECITGKLLSQIRLDFHSEQRFELIQKRKQ